MSINKPNKVSDKFSVFKVLDFIPRFEPSFNQLVETTDQFEDIIKYSRLLTFKWKHKRQSCIITM